MKRRSFIKLSAATAGYTSLGIWQSCVPNQESAALSALSEAFLFPNREAKPFMRWWWNGNILQKRELERELDVMHQAGVGGVEITPIAMPEEIDIKDKNQLIWLSDEWLDMVKFTIEKAHERNMVVDMIVGTGWPFGGDFLETSETIQGIELQVLKITGPKQFKAKSLWEDEDYPSRVMQAKLIPEGIRNFAQAINYQPDNKQTSITIDVPAGTWNVHILHWRQNYDQVFLGAPGGDGPVLDHLNETAVRKYLTHTSARLKTVFGNNLGEHIRSMFCDSIELHGANWTDDLPEEFEKRRGYSLTDYLCFIPESAPVYPELQTSIEKIRYDFYRTLSELFTERFIHVFHGWCQELGVKSRYQAYGFPFLYTHMTDGAVIPDIPEGDQFLYNGAWQPYANINDIRYAIWNKYAAAGGKIAGRKIVSTEAMTNLKGVFQTTLGYKKQATDLDFCAGINHLILHGFNYSPPEAGFPGWVRFGTYYNEKNTWWPHFKEWASYTARISAVLQEAKPVTHIALLGPIEAVWASKGFDRNAYNATPWFYHAIWQALNHNGCIADYLSPNLLLEAHAENNKLKCRSASFNTLIVVTGKYIQSGILEKLNALKNQGIQVILLGDFPEILIDTDSAHENIDPSNFTQLDQYPAPGEPEKESQQALAQWTRHFIEKTEINPLIVPENPHPSFFFQYATDDDREVFLLCNSSETEPLSTKIKLPIANHTHLEVFIAETGEQMQYPHTEGIIELDLLPTGSHLFISGGEPNSNLEIYKPTGDFREKITPIDAWDVECTDVTSGKSTLQMESLQDISELEAFKNFSGSITYQCKFRIEDSDFEFIDFGDTTDSIEVYLNDTNLGIRWHRGQLIRLQGSLKAGENGLKLIVKTTLYNYAQTLNNNAMAMKWVNNANSKNAVPTGLTHPVFLVKSKM